MNLSTAKTLNKNLTGISLLMGQSLNIGLGTVANCERGCYEKHLTLRVFASTYKGCLSCIDTPGQAAIIKNSFLASTLAPCKHEETA